VSGQDHDGAARRRPQIVDRRQSWPRVRFAGGIALTPVLHLAGVRYLSKPFLSVFRYGYGELFGWQGSFIILIGLYQFVYVLPALILLALMRQGNVARGLLAGALLTVLLNGGCFLVVRFAS
jgi:hypothetical protein